MLKMTASLACSKVTVTSTLAFVGDPCFTKGLLPPSPFDENAQTIANMPGGEPYRPPGGAFAPGRRTGPAEDHRDGGGPDTSLDTPDDLDEDDLDIPV